MTPAELRDLILTAEGALVDARDACRVEAHETNEPAPWRALTELTIGLRHVGAALIAMERTVEQGPA